MSKISLSGNSSGTGTLTLAAPNTNSDFTLSLPATTAPILAGSGITLSASAPANTLVTTAAGNVGIGTATAAARLTVGGASQNDTGAATFPGAIQLKDQGLSTVQATGGLEFKGSFSGAGYGSKITGSDDGQMLFGTRSNSASFTERMRIDSDGNLLVGATATGGVSSGKRTYINIANVGELYVASDGGEAAIFNRNASDGVVVSIRQANTQEGNISVSGTTVSYNGGHLSRWAQTTTAKDESLVKGTVLSNLDEMNVYTDAEGNTVQNEQLNKVKVSDVEGDANVAGVFVNWDHDEAHNVDEINMAMTGDMIIRIAQGVTVQRGDLLMSAGDGTAKPQGDDIVRSKTIAKVTSTHVTCTYADGSFCVPCVLMAC